MMPVFWSKLKNDLLIYIKYSASTMLDNSRKCHVSIEIDHNIDSFFFVTIQCSRKSHLKSKNTKNYFVLIKQHQNKTPIRPCLIINREQCLCRYVSVCNGPVAVQDWAGCVNCSL